MNKYKNREVKQNVNENVNLQMGKDKNNFLIIRYQLDRRLKKHVGVYLKEVVGDLVKKNQVCSVAWEDNNGNGKTHEK